MPFFSEPIIFTDENWLLFIRNNISLWGKKPLKLNGKHHQARNKPNKAMISKKLLMYPFLERTLHDIFLLRARNTVGKVPDVAPPPVFTLFILLLFHFRFKDFQISKWIMKIRMTQTKTNRRKYQVILLNLTSHNETKSFVMKWKSP